MEGYLNLISVPAIATIVYWVINIIKHAVGENEKFKRFIPLIATGFGVICGVICYFALPEIIPADNIVVAIVLGGSSGLTAIGANQMIRQLSKKEENNAQKQEEYSEKEKDPAENNAPKKK